MARNTEMALAHSQKSMEKHIECLSTGYHINTPADDPTGYSISQRMGGQVKSYNAAQHNASDSVNYPGLKAGAFP